MSETELNEIEELLLQIRGDIALMNTEEEEGHEMKGSVVQYLCIDIIDRYLKKYGIDQED